MTSLKAPFSPTILALAIALTAGFSPSGRAQSDSDLRRQNQELTSRVQDLEAELDAARKEITTLQQRIAQLETQLAAARAVGRPGGGGGGSTPIPPLEDEPVTVDESKASGSPRALFAAITESYKKAIGDEPIGKGGVGGAGGDDRERITYMRRLDKWEPVTEREYRMPIEWHVRLMEARLVDSRRERIATFVAVDPVTDVKLGDHFDVALTGPLASRLQEHSSRGDEVFVLKGTTVVNIRINPDRDSRGSFDNPRFVGPFAEFEFTVDPSSIVPAPPAKPEAATQPASTKPAPVKP